MDTLKNISFSIALFIIGAIFILLGLSGGVTINNNSLIMRELWEKSLSTIIGLSLVITAVYLELRGKLPSRESKNINEFHEPSNHELFLNRKEIHWAPYNEKVSSRYWACGTSLIGVFEFGLIQKFANAGVRDIKIMLPNTDKSYISFEQLDKFDQLNIGIIENQVDLAKLAYEKFQSINLPNLESDEILKKYSGIMFSNITIFDDDAFIAFYDCTGSGGSNFTLHFNKSKNKLGYSFVESEFLRMWDTKKAFGKKFTKKIGTSIFFLNNANQILLFLRDDKKNIPFPNCWDALGGNVDEGETPLECIKREMAEEIGIQIESPVLFNIYNKSDRIECTFWQRANLDIKKINLKEGQRLKWFTEKEINMMTDDDLAFEFKPIMLDFFRLKPYKS
jgi:8-oxo-dGTP diphosphatase